MKNILVVKSSISGAQSHSNQLADAIVERIQSRNKDSQTTIRDVASDHAPHIDLATFTTFRTPVDQWTAEDNRRAQYSEQVIAELNEAEIIVIAIPMYQFSIPSQLKTWLDNASRAGKTFSYSANGPQGLLKNKKVYLAISSGGVYSQGPMAAVDFTESYMRAVLGFFGLTDITTFRVEGTAIPERKDSALAKAIEQIVL